MNARLRRLQRLGALWLAMFAAACGASSSLPVDDASPWTFDGTAPGWDMGGYDPGTPADGGGPDRPDQPPRPDAGGDTTVPPADVPPLDDAPAPRDGHDAYDPPELHVLEDYVAPQCQPDEVRCEGSTLLLRCNFLRQWDAVPCTAGTACFEGECRPQVCTAGQIRCVSDHAYDQCHHSGTFWDESKDCSGRYFCDLERNECLCINPANIMFVLDASGSMQLRSVNGQTQWDIARQAIYDIMEAYPHFQYGLATFPDTTVNCSPTLCIGNGGCDTQFADQSNFEVGNLPADLNGYLASRLLSADTANLQYVRTPLLGILRYFISGYLPSAPLKSSPNPSYLVVVSDGEDSCHHVFHPEYAIGPIGQAVRQLRDEFHIKTFSIGFNLESGQEQLNAIAMNGGTGLARHLSAADMPTLLSALAEVVELIDPYKCVGTNDILPPACPDGDGDGWCDFADCNDADAAVHPAAAEVAGNGRDDNCNGQNDEPPPEQVDDDGDGVAEVDGDCNDFAAGIGPMAVDGSGPDADGSDNDCDGQIDEGPACGTCQALGSDVANVVCAMELCDSQFLLSAVHQSPSQIPAASLRRTIAAVTRFGQSSNELAPRAGSSYGLMATGPATGTQHTEWLCAEDDWVPCPYSGDTMFDAIDIALTLKAPSNAQGFSFEYVFLSEEYEEFIGTEFNDKFFVVMNAPETTGGQDRIINFTNCRSGGYYDFNDPACSGQRCCYIAVNTAFSEPCPNAATNIAGTGFECPAGWFGFDTEYTGSSTGWLRTTMTVAGGETFTLRFHIHDTADGIYDSEVILDNFRWRTTPVTPGTEPTGDGT